MSDLLNSGSWARKLVATAVTPAGSLTDFFFAASIDSSRTNFWASVRSDGGDVRVKVDGVQVPSWIDSNTWNYGGTTGLVYFARPGSSATAPVIEIYYGNASATAFTNTDPLGQFAVFPTSLKAFYPRGGGNDVTSNLKHLTMSGSPTVGGVAGPISGSKATDLNGSSQYGTSAVSVPAGQPISLLASINADQATANNDVFSVYETTGDGGVGLLVRGAVASDPIGMIRRNTAAGAGAFEVTEKIGYTPGTWYSAACTATNTAGIVYLDGAAGTAGTTSLTLSSWTSPLINVGRRNATFPNYYDGKISFAGVYTSVLSADYIAYWHAMLANQGTFYSDWIDVPVIIDLSDGLEFATAHWHLDEASGSMTDVISGLVLTEQSGTIDAYPGGGRDFEAGDTEYAETPSVSQLVAGNRSFGVTFWMRPESTGSSGIVMHKGWQSASDVNREWVLYWASTTALNFTYANSNNPNSLNLSSAGTGVSMAASNLYFGCIWYDAITDTFNISINDSSPATASNALGTYAGTRPFVLGASAGQSLYYDGVLRGVTFFANGFPNAAKRTFLYNSGTYFPYPWTVATGRLGKRRMLGI